MRHVHLLGLGVCLLGLMGCDDNGSKNDVPDASTADAEPDMADPHNGFRLPVCEDTQPVGTANLDPVPSTLVGRITPTVTRQATPGPLNPVSEDGELMYAQLGYDHYTRGDGQDLMTRDELTGRDGTWTQPNASERRSIAWFTHLSDFQILDDESPNRLSLLDNPGIPSGLRSQEMYLTHEVSAVNRTLTQLTEGGRQFDFGIITGDCADSAQTNEFRWFIDVMNGKSGLEVDSGDDNDPVPGPGNDPKDPYDPVAFPAPWLFVPGNHDVLVVGIALPSDENRATALGMRATGTRDYAQWWAPIRSGMMTPDPMRALIERQDIVEMLRADTTGHGPQGHGFTTDTPDLSLGANYVYDAIPGLLRMIVIDTSDETGGSNGMITETQMNNFILPAIQAAEEDGLLVMLASHHSPTASDIYEGQVGTNPVPGAMTQEQIETAIAGEPSVIAWLVGHNHDNRVRAVTGADASHPGYWEIMTSAIADWPAQVRTIELVDNGDGTLSIFGVMIDYNEETCFERRARRLTMMEWVSAWTDPVSLAAKDYNVELVRPIPSNAVNAVGTASAAAPSRLETETTLRGL